MPLLTQLPHDRPVGAPSSLCRGCSGGCTDRLARARGRRASPRRVTLHNTVIVALSRRMAAWCQFASGWIPKVKGVYSLSFSFIDSLHIHEGRSPEKVCDLRTAVRWGLYKETDSRYQEMLNHSACLMLLLHTAPPHLLNRRRSGRCCYRRVRLIRSRSSIRVAWVRIWQLERSCGNGAQCSQ